MPTRTRPSPTRGEGAPLRAARARAAHRSSSAPARRAGPGSPPGARWSARSPTTSSPALARAASPTRASGSCRPRPDAPVPVDALLRIPEAYRFLRGEERLVERLCAALRHVAHRPGGRSRCSSSSCGCRRFVPAIYTTNFDDLLERTFALGGRAVPGRRRGGGPPRAGSSTRSTAASCRASRSTSCTARSSAPARS